MEVTTKELSQKLLGCVDKPSKHVPVSKRDATAPFGDV
jgi:hypothetical protein